MVCADAVHPTHAVRTAGCWAPGQEKLAIEQTSGRQRINIRGAIGLETGLSRMIEVETVSAGFMSRGSDPKNVVDLDRSGNAQRRR